MGFIDGMIIGGVIGGAVGGAYAYQMVRWKKKFLATLQTRGPQPARSLLDKYAGPTKRGKFPLKRLALQRARFAALSILDQMDDVADELGWHEGGVAFKLQVRAFGHLCLAVRDENPAAHLPAIDSVVREVEAEASTLQHLLKNQARMLGQLAHAMAGTPLAPEDRTRILKWCSKEGALEKAVMYYAVVRADTAAGVRDEPLVRKLREITDAFALQHG